MQISTSAGSGNRRFLQFAFDVTYRYSDFISVYGIGTINSLPANHLDLLLSAGEPLSNVGHKPFLLRRLSTTRTSWLIDRWDGGLVCPARGAEGLLGGWALPLLM